MSSDGARNLWSLVESRAQASPAGTAFIVDDEVVTYARFRDLCLRTTTWLSEQGIGSGDSVAVWLVNRVEWLALFFATARLGATLVPINTRYRSEEVTYLLNKSGARILFLQPGFRKIDFAAILANIDAEALPALERIAVFEAGTEQPAAILGRPTVVFDPRACMPADDQDESDPEACCVVFSTSGTTKGPKLVMHPQRTLVYHAHRCASAFGLDDGSAVVMAMLPFCGVFGLTVALSGLAAGAPIVMVDTFDAGPTAQLMQRHGVTHTFGSDEMILRLSGAAPGDRPFPALRFFGFGAFTSSFSEEAMQAWQRGIPLYGMYGSSEVLALFSTQHAGLPIEQRIEGGGRPVAGDDAHIRIRDLDTGNLLPVGETGEIEIRGPSNFIGYFNDPSATAEVVDADGYFHTGDIGYLRGDGSFVYKTRKGDAIRLGGFLVNPVEIEEVLKRLDGVADAQVAAVDIDGTTRVVAFVIADRERECSESRLIDQMRAIVAPFKVPARIWFVDEYPVTLSSNGLKTQRNKLRDMAKARLAAASEDTA